ncbi:DUF4296 domain-containing protein [Spirosoma sp. RP8]|uniref:DUF4296 domain-containing protein n=1 Tax=Spirosoma liriopis TaxID=2937440 RepID=A0ABT0HGX9_9BACT|nr:DUF4296 domain-containing protein [Spirosoma liriopis]MCK8491431.1 DUF4296 domain-containing protein [Spirosoma liriopis]
MRWHLMKQTIWMGLAMLYLSLLQGCQPPEDKRPDNLIPEERMVAILTEVHILEARVGRMGLRSTDSSNVAYHHLEKQIFRKFKVDTAAYSKSYAYYAAHPRAMETIYQQVVDNLKKKTEPQKPARS